MNYSAALRWYIVLLLAAIVGIFIALPNTVETTLAGRHVRFSKPAALFTLFGRTIVFNPTLQFGLDINGGARVTLVADTASLSESEKKRAIDGVREVIARRIDLYGIKEASVVTSTVDDQHRLHVSIPGVSNTDQALSMIGTTARLDFREYKPASNSASASPSGILVSDFVSTDLTGKDLRSAVADYDDTIGQIIIYMEFNPEGTRKFAEITQRSIGKPLAIFIDDYPLSAPIVENAIVDGRAQISGNFDASQAKSLAATLNAGALPVSVQPVSQETVHPELGANAVQSLFRAGVIGIGLVLLFMILVYGVKGIFACLSLLLYAVLSIAVYKLIPITLTLPGIAGFLLSIGMAVDTNILVFERLREEEQKGYGNTLGLLSAAFGRAFDSIKDANVATLAVAFILANPLGWSFFHASGPVRGFAVTLMLGIVLNLFTGMIATRILMTLFYKPKENNA